MHAILLAACCLITGHVHAASGAPLADAHLALRGATRQTATTDPKGSFQFSAAPGDYTLDTAAQGYGSVSIDLGVSKDSTVEVTLEPLDAPTLRTIGTVRVDGRLSPVRGAIPSITVTRADMDRMGDTQAIQGLQTLPGATFARPDGGSGSSIAVVALRGPDPSESLVALDGQLLNDGNTGDLDLSRIPVSILSSLNVTEGLGPQDTNGSNTFGGAINFISLRPTKDPHVAFGENAGSWGQSEVWMNATGTKDRWGYALALDDSHSAGYVNQLQTVFPPGSDPTTCSCGASTLLGSSLSARSALASLTYSFSQSADITARYFVLGDQRDQSASVNGIDGLLDLTQPPPQPPVNPTYGDFIGNGNMVFSQVLRAYQIRARAPLGAGELTADVSDSDNGVDINGASSGSPYDLQHVDQRYNGGLTWQRTFDTSQFAVGGYTRYEDLLTPGVPTLDQTINVGFVRGGIQATKELKLDAGLFYSHYTTFGANLDGRFSAIYNTDPSTAIRFSLGTGFRAPLLIERYAFPLDQLTTDSNGVFTGQGSPGELPEHATEYELGASHQFASSTLDVSLYTTNLRNPVEIYYPYQLTNPAGGGPSLCLGNTAAAPIPGCVSYQSNVGNAVYQGIEVRYVQSFVPQHFFLTAMYGLNISYPKDLTNDFSNPTFGGNLVDNQQFPGVTPQQGSVELDWANYGMKAAVNTIFRGSNNELGQPPFTTFNASVGFKLNDLTDISFSGTNLFNAGAGRYTIYGAGVPYPGNGGLIPVDRLAVEPFGLLFHLVIHV